MIEVKNLNKTYNRRLGDNRVLKDISFTLPDTGFICILGPSGCGKTSLLNALGGLDKFDNGRLSTDSVTVSRYGTLAYEAERNRNFGYIFQNYYLLENHSVAYNVYLGLHSLDLSHKEKLKRVRMALKAVDMDRYIRRKVGDLSGGQQQRIAIARALARRPRVIFADEPTGNLDESNTQNICTLLRQASMESLVIMVTHEERIARFFADRIITLDQGRIDSDSTEWARESLSLESGKAVYAGDYAETRLEDSQVSLRLLQSPDAPPVELTVVATKDRILLKLSDGRAISLSEGREPPEILEGKRPVMTLEAVDRRSDSQSDLFHEPPAPQCRAGKGLTIPMMTQEARLLSGDGKGMRRTGMRIFLILLTVLTLLTAADYIAVSRIDPEDFILTDSHILELELQQGSVLRGNAENLQVTQREYLSYLLNESGLDFDLLPYVNTPPKYSAGLYDQMKDVSLSLPAFSYVYQERFDESTLLMGRAAENSDEIVVDRQVLEAILKTEGIVQKSIPNIEYFLNKTLSFDKKPQAFTIVGICDSGERSIFVTKSAMVSIGVAGTKVMRLSELKARFPGEYDDITLTDQEFLGNTEVLGDGFRVKYKPGANYTVNGRTTLTLYQQIARPEITAGIIVADSLLDTLLLDMFSYDVKLYCPDKAAMKAFLNQGSQWEEDGFLTVSWSDPWQEQYDRYAEAAHLRADARIIVTGTILVLAMVMLFLLCRAQVQSRIELLAVYRLLGIPGRKLYGIFLMEGGLSALATILPTTVLVWLAVSLSQLLPELEMNLVLPWQAAGMVSLAILVYYLLVSILPLIPLLRLPPAQLAAKYDA